MNFIDIKVYTKSPAAAKGFGKVLYCGNRTQFRQQQHSTKGASQLSIEVQLPPKTLTFDTTIQGNRRFKSIQEGEARSQTAHIHKNWPTLTFRNMSFCSTLWIFPGLISPLSVYSKNFPLTLTSRVVNGLSSCEQLSGLSRPLEEGVPYLKITPTIRPARRGLKIHEADLTLLYRASEFGVSTEV